MGLLASAWSAATSFARETSLAGLSNAGKARSPLGACYWLSLFVAGLAFTIPAIVEIFADYMKHPVNVNTYLRENKQKAEFPAVTVCALNRVACDYLLTTQIQYLANESYWEGMGIGTEAEAAKIAQELEDIMDLSYCRNTLCKYVYMSTFLSTTDTGYIFNYAYYLHCWKVWPDRQTPRYVLFKKMCGYYTQYSPDPVRAAHMNCSEGFVPDDLIDPEDVATIIGNPFENYTSTDRDNELSARLLTLPAPVRRRIVQHNGVSFDACKFQSNEQCFDELEEIKWTRTDVPGYGSCFTFNSRQNKDDRKVPRNVSLTGRSNGLEASFNLEQLLYMGSDLTPEGGVRVVIHPAGDLPMVNDDGINVKPNTASSIGIKKSEIIRMPAPYTSKCKASWEETNFDTGLMKSGDELPKYSLAACQGFCLQNAVVSKCGCFHVHLDLSVINVGDYGGRGLAPCTLRNTTESNDLACVSKVLDDVDAIDCTTCEVPCKEDRYDITYTVSTWPSDAFWRDLAVQNFFGVGDTYDRSLEPDIRKIVQRDFLKINVYFKTLSVHVVEETAKYDLATIMNALGGAMGLYLGIALIALFEVVEVALFGFCKRRQQQPNEH